MLVYGHRGASKEALENTLEAFRLALELGADAIETDVHVTRDGAVVIHHDADGARTAGDMRKVSALTLAEVRAWDVAKRARDRLEPGLADTPYGAPTFDAALEEFSSVRVNVDVKAHASSAIERVLEVVARHRAEARVLLTSFSDAVVAEIRARGYRGEIGLARNAVMRALALPAGTPKRFLPFGHRVQIPPAFGPLRLDRPGVIRRLHAHGFAVDYWVVDDPAVARALRDAGADGVMADDVRAVVQGLSG